MRYPASTSTRTELLRKSFLRIPNEGKVGIVLAIIFLMAVFDITRSKMRPAGDAHAQQHAAVHGGVIQEIGGHHHVEALLESGGVLRLYIMSREVTELEPIPSTTLAAQIQAEGEQEHLPIQLAAAPSPDDPPGAASSFQALLPTRLQDAALTMAVTLPINGKQYRLRFELPASGGEAHTAGGGMPSGVGGTDAEKQLYLTPGGVYTEADIAANGRTVPSEKLRGFRPQHDMHPKPGDLICPVTETKANPTCTWIVGGKIYQFCCPPCIDEFVTWAKTQPEKIRPPDQYFKR